MTTRSQQRALHLYVALLFTLAAAMAWLVGRGITRGETWLPMTLQEFWPGGEGRVAMRY